MYPADSSNFMLIPDPTHKRELGAGKKLWCSIAAQEAALPSGPRRSWKWASPMSRTLPAASRRFSKPAALERRRTDDARRDGGRDDVGHGRFGLLVIVVLVLGAIALAKYVFSRK